MANQKAKKQVLLGVTGSIAAYKACDMVRMLQRKGHEVTVIMTQEAQKFITPLTLASLSEHRVYTDMFEKEATVWEKEHISLAEKAEVLLIAPATAHIIGKIANGLADDLLSAVAITTKAPIILAPAMNSGMYHNKIVQHNIKKLRQFNIHIIEPVKGKLACGSVGCGHLADTETIVKKVCALLKNK